MLFHHSRPPRRPQPWHRAIAGVAPDLMPGAAILAGALMLVLLAGLATPGVAP